MGVSTITLPPPNRRGIAWGIARSTHADFLADFRRSRPIRDGGVVRLLLSAFCPQSRQHRHHKSLPAQLVAVEINNINAEQWG